MQKSFVGVLLFVIMISSVSAISVESFTIVDASENKVIAKYANLQEDTIVYLEDISDSINIVANVDDDTRKVRFYINNARRKTENSFPYSLFGDFFGNYFGWSPDARSHVISAESYGRNGVQGESLSVVLTFKSKAGDEKGSLDDDNLDNNPISDTTGSDDNPECSINSECGSDEFCSVNQECLDEALSCADIVLSEDEVNTYQGYDLILKGVSDDQRAVLIEINGQLLASTLADIEEFDLAQDLQVFVQEVFNDRARIYLSYDLDSCSYDFAVLSDDDVPTSDNDNDNPTSYSGSEDQNWPASCETWYDGCNTCSQNNGQVICTTGFCNQEMYEEARCLDAEESDDENTDDQSYTYDENSPFSDVLIDKVQLVELGEDGFVINWETSEPTSGAVEYGLTGTFGRLTNNIVFDASRALTTHQVQVSNADPGTTYFYRVVGQDSKGNIYQSYLDITRTYGDVILDTENEACISPRPEICTLEYDPVCGFDSNEAGLTYTNECAACADLIVEYYTPGICDTEVLPLVP